jgi:hypothetical protein
MFIANFAFAKSVVKVELSRFGKVIAGDVRTIKALVIFYPPATGDKGQQKDEALHLQSLGYVSLLYDPPYRDSSKEGGIACQCPR